jgi:hypothetical protein
LGVPDYLGWNWKSKAGIPIVCVPGCPTHPDNLSETILYLLYQATGGGVNDFIEWFFKAERGELEPFVLVIEGSIPNEAIKPQGYWCGFGNIVDQASDVVELAVWEDVAPDERINIQRDHRRGPEMSRWGFEIRHEENLREHYARTLSGWCANLDRHWDDAVHEVGEQRARIWRLYLATCVVGFERNNIQLHQILGVKLGTHGESHMPLRSSW